MIAKRTARRHDSKSSFATLVKYIIRGDAMALDEGIDVIISNCGVDDPAVAIKIVEATQNLNQRAGNDKTYHLVVSFREDDSPTREQLVDIERSLVGALGFGDHQRIAAIHRDTDHTHLHVAINKIHPESLRIVEPFRDFYVLDEMCAQLEQKHGLAIDNRIDREDQTQRRTDTRVAQMEHHSGLSSFKSWVLNRKSPIVDCMQNASSWREFHHALAEFDLTVRPRGAGFVIASLSEQAFMRASDVDRSLSKKALEDRYGTYESAVSKAIELIAPKQRYTKTLLVPSPDLWAAFQVERERRVGQRAIGMQRIRSRRDERIAEVQSAFRSERHRITNIEGVSRRYKRQLHLDAAAKRKGQYAAIRARYKKEVQALRHETAHISWSQFLVEKAVDGDEAALKALRKQAGRGALNLPGLVGEISHDVLVGMKPTITKNGDVLYALRTGTARDSGGKLSIDVEDMESVVQGLRLAADKWGQTLSVEGNANFKMKVAEAAVVGGLDIRFTDHEAEQRRQLLAELHKEQKKYAQRSPRELIADWVKSRNNVRATDVRTHRVFDPKDSGETEYKGTRRIAPGVQVALVERNGQMLVVPISEKQRARVKREATGQSVNVDRSGRITFSRTKEQGLGR